MAISRDWIEPAHPAALHEFEQYVDLYRAIQRIQGEIDRAFDSASRQIGFVITTTLPIQMRCSEQGLQVELAKGLAGTIFEGAFAPVIEALVKGGAERVKTGVFDLYLIWHDALKLKLKVDWVEPAHVAAGLRPDIVSQLALAARARALAGAVRPEVVEPAHWFDIGAALSSHDELVIAAIDEVYPDVKLAERVASVRRDSRLRLPGVREPAHFREILEVLLDRLAVSRPRGPAGGDPAHRTTIDEVLGRPDAAALVDELVAVLRKFGV
jgi:hypothetical protein